MVKLRWPLLRNLKDNMPQPSHIVLISPVLDATFSNPEAQKYEKGPMLGIEGSKYLVELWAGNTSLDDYKISPINGDLDGLGHITIAIGTRKRLYPDAVKLSHMLNEKVSVTSLFKGIICFIFIRYSQYLNANVS